MYFINFQAKLPKKLQKQLKKVIPVLCKSQRKIISITFTDNKMLKNLNYKFRKINKPTDVLSFPFEDKQLLGDIFISLPKARENAKIYGNTWLGELLYLTIHGLCHLAGHDHGNKKQIAAMRKAEQKLLNKLKALGIEIKGRI